MGLTSRKPRPLKRQTQHRDSRLIIIATEGQETEKQYFEMFDNPRVQVYILNTENTKSAPQHVFERLEKFKQEYQLNSDDQLWLMIDVDCWPKRKLSEIAAESKRKDFQMAVSNPCFELWLFLHRSDVAQNTKFTSKEMKKELRKILRGYDHINLKPDDFMPFVEEAVKRAKALDGDPKERWPSKTGTHVYKVATEILSRK